MNGGLRHDLLVASDRAKAAPSARFVRALLVCFACALTSLFAHPARALSEDEAVEAVEDTLSIVSKRLPEVLKLEAKRPPTPEQRLAAGEVLLRQRNYERSIDILNQVMELFRQGKTQSEVHADALYLLAESYFRADQLLAARRKYLELVSLAETPTYAIHAGRSLARLVDIALRTSRLEELHFVLSEVARLGARTRSTALRYAEAKALFALRRYPEAERLLGAIPKTSSVYPQAQYILGVIYMNRALEEPKVEPSAKEAEQVPAAAKRFARAVIQFQRVTQLEVESEDHRHVVDLAWMALGRLFYEVDDLLDAADAHAHVERGSPEFANMLFELSWVYVRLADFERAERGLEVLSVVSPDKLDFAESSLLRADLMLRAKEFDGALAGYRSVLRRFEPVQGEIDAFVLSNRDPSAYYDRLVEDRLGIKTRGALPPVVMDWLREESEDERVFSLIDDITLSHELTERSERTIRRLESVLASPVRVRGFPDLSVKLRGIVGLMNRITLARRDLALGLEAANESALAGEIGSARATRRGLTAQLDWFPTLLRDFSRREASGLRRWNGVSQKLQRLQLQVDRLQAVANGLRRLLREKDRFGVALDAAVEARIRSELDLTEREVATYLSQIETHRESIERARLQVGFGDVRYQRDERVRVAFTRAMQREFELALEGQAGADAAEFARRSKPLVDRLDRMEQKLAKLRQGFDAEIAERSALIEAEVREEEAKLEAHLRELETLDQEARTQVGEVAMRDFARVKERLRGIVLRADVGIAQQGWEVREEHLDRVTKLQRERARGEEELEEEMSEVLFSGERRDEAEEAP